MGFDIGIFRVVASAVSKAAKAVLLSLDSGGTAADPDHWNEGAIAQPSFGSPGIVFRPRPPTTEGGQRRQLEAIALDADGLFPLAYRDLRWNGFYPAPKEGDLAWVGYAGAFDSNSPKFDAAGKPASSERVIYVPYAFAGGAPVKAHVIEIIGTAGNESISIIHGDGMAVTMSTGGKNSVVIKNKSGTAYVEVNDEGVTINGNMIVNGGATLGSPVGALPAAIAPKLAAYLAQLEIDIGAALTAVGVGSAAAGSAGASAFAATATGRATLVAAIAATKTSVA